MSVRIIVKAGKCQGGYHPIGQTFVVDDVTPAGMCTDAWSAIAPYVMTLRSGGNFSWMEEKGVVHIHCPDPKGITFEIRRIEKG